MDERAQRVITEFQACPIKPVFPVKQTEEVMVPMSDGCRLRTVIVRPDVYGPVPTVIVRSCYISNHGRYMAAGREYASRGIAYVFQYCRGTAGSEGIWEPYEHDRPDGLDFMKWVEQQDWIGETGFYGNSYYAFTGWAIADLVTPKIKTMYLTHYGTNRYISVYKDGLFRHDIFTDWTMTNAGFPIDADFEQSCLYHPHNQVDVALWGKEIPWYRNYVNSPDLDAPYWQNGIWKITREIPEKVSIPLCVVESWYDHHLGAALDAWSRLSPECRNKSKLVIGGWNHMFDMCLQDRICNDARNNDNIRAFDWFYTHLVKKEQAHGEAELYIASADRWVTLPRYGKDDPSSLRLYLGAPEQNKLLTLSQQPCAQSGQAQYQYDPMHPRRSHGGESLLHSKSEIGSLLQPPAAAPADGLCCISQPITQDITILGQIKLHMTVSSTADDTAFAFKVMEVLPDGRAYNIRTGITTLAYRNGSTKRLEYRSGDTADIVIDSWDVAYHIKAGSRLRVDISSADFPQYTAHSNFAGPWAEQEKTQIATQTVFWGHGSSSWLELPVYTPSNH